MPRADAYQPPREVGAYRVHELIGRGGMGSVFRGEHALLERPVAIKFLRAEIAASPEARERFLREARLVAKLSHPNIVAVFDFGVLPDGTYYQASELVGGDTLRARLRTGPLDTALAIRFARQLADGLAAAHELGIVHRDLKPSNIMVIPDAGGERVKILDFGIAKRVDTEAGSVTRTGIAIGTPGYMSPEQCRGDAVLDPASDIYSLGVVLFAMLCGRTPFDAKDTDLLLDQHLHDVPMRPGELVACPPDLDALVVRCLAKSPRARPSARELVGALDALGNTPNVMPAPSPGMVHEHGTAKLAPASPRLQRLAFGADAIANEPATRSSAVADDPATSSTAVSDETAATIAADGRATFAGDSPATSTIRDRRRSTAPLVGGIAVLAIAVAMFVVFRDPSTAPSIESRQDRDKPIEQTADKPIEQTTDKLVEQTPDKPVEQANKPIEQTTDKPVDKSSDADSDAIDLQRPSSSKKPTSTAKRGKTKTAKPIDTKVTETKSTETKPTDTKPTDTKPRAFEKAKY